jgi:hypothetical protein
LEFRKTALFFSLPKQAALTFWLRAPRVSENTLDEHFLQRISARFDGLICCLFLSLFPRFFADGIHHVICERARVFLIRPHATFGSNYLANNVGDKLSFDQYSENKLRFLEKESTATQFAAKSNDFGRKNTAAVACFHVIEFSLV